MTLRGFGFTYDVQRGTSRQWYAGEDGMIGAAFSPDGLRYRLTVAVDKA